MKNKFIVLTLLGFVLLVVLSGILPDAQSSKSNKEQIQVRQSFNEILAP